MAALSSSTFHQHVKPPPAKKAKTEHVPEPPLPVVGITNAIMTPGRDEVFLLEGDRHFWTDEIEQEWKQHFHKKVEHPTEKDKRGKPVKIIAGAPFQVYTVQDRLQFQGVLYNNVEQARHILKHMLSKKWVPTCCFLTPEAALAAVESQDVSQVPDHCLAALHNMLSNFTIRVSNLHYQELVMGGVEGGPTMDMGKVQETLYAESREEAGLSEQQVCSRVQFKTFSDPFRGSVNAIYVSTFIDKSEMDDIWRRADVQRRPPGGVPRWRCPHAWYKCIPGIDKDSAKVEKADNETRNGRWFLVDEALNRKNFCDKKNIAMLEKILGH